jgi:hypothetical protein
MQTKFVYLFKGMKNDPHFEEQNKLPTFYQFFIACIAKPSTEHWNFNLGGQLECSFNLLQQLGKHGNFIFFKFEATCCRHSKPPEWLTDKMSPVYLLCQS